MLLPMLLGPIADYYLMEAFVMDPFVETRVRAQLLNIAFYELVMLALFFAIGKLSIALEAETVFFALVGLTNYAVLSFRSTPIVPWDIFSIGTGVSVLRSYDLTFHARQWLTLLGFVLLYFLQLPAKWKLDRKRAAVRIGGCAAAILCFFSLGKFTQTDAGVEKLHLYPFLFTPTIMAERNGFFVTYIMDHKYLTVEKPAGYSKEAAETLLQEAGALREDTAGAGNAVYPHLIVIMDEAFSDLSVLGNLETNTDPVPFLHSLQQSGANTVTGELSVSVKGGNTANTEFEFLTGNTMAFLPEGSIPYQQYVTHDLDALPRYLTSLGYTSTAIHPYRAAGWNRDTVYPRLGFTQSLFREDFTAPTRVRSYISDESSFAKIVEVYEAGDGPQFIFNVTMQNHGGYGEGAENFPEDVAAENADNAYLDRYLSLLKITDDALKHLISYFENEEEPVVLVFFGDHQPNDTVAAPVLAANGRSVKDLTDEEEDQRYLVPYLIWANFPLEAEHGKETSVNYLAGQMLFAAGVPLSDYQLFLTEQETAFPILSAQRVVDAAGNRSTAEELGAPLDDYRRVQYYELFEKAEN